MAGDARDLKRKPARWWPLVVRRPGFGKKTALATAEAIEVADNAVGSLRSSWGVEPFSFVCPAVKRRAVHKVIAHALVGPLYAVEESLGGPAVSQTGVEKVVRLTPGSGVQVARW